MVRLGENLLVAVVLLGGVTLLAWPTRAPWLVGLSASLAFLPWWRAWTAARGTALRGALVWGAIMLGSGVVSQWIAATEPGVGGRPLAGFVTYLTTLAALAALTSVLNARTPGGGAWALLTALLVLVLLIPCLEGVGLKTLAGAASRGLRLRLDSPWTLFYGFLVVAGVTNYLPTRHGPAAILAGLGFGLEYLVLTGRLTGPAARTVVVSAVPWCFAASVVAAGVRGRGARPSGGELEALWTWFRDAWGVVWALRILERFNRSAEAQAWHLRLTWQGPITDPSVGPVVPSDETGAAVLAGLLRRFATSGRLAEASRIDSGRPCDHPDLPRR